MHIETQALKIIEQVSLDNYTTKEKKKIFCLVQQIFYRRE